jgi:vancomycin resistance protein VanJ
MLPLQKRLNLKFSTLISYISWGYVILFTLWILSRLLFFDKFWWLALINTIALYLFVPLILFIPLALVWRQWKLIFGLGFPLGVFIAFYGSLFLPQFPSLGYEAVQPQITAMTFNMLFSNDDYDEIGRMIKASSPDIVGIQEVPPNGDAAWIKRFSSEYPYYAFRPVEEGHNVGLISRFPIENVTMLSNSPMRRALSATVNITKGRVNKSLQVIVSHLTPNYPPNEFIKFAREWYTRRANEVTYLRSLIQKRRLPTIMLCDCNYVDTSQAYARTHEVMQDSFREVGWGFGHTWGSPNFRPGRIDFVWYTKELKALEAWVPDGGGSDHLAVAARLKL